VTNVPYQERFAVCSDALKITSIVRRNDVLHRQQSINRSIDQAPTFRVAQTLKTIALTRLY